MSVAPGSYVHPFVPTSQSTAAISGGTTSGLFDLVGPRFRATAYSGKSQVLLYRGGVRVLAAPGISTQTRTLEGPPLSCASEAGIGRPPVASCTTLGSCYKKKYAVKKSGPGCPRRPIPKKIDERFLANTSILPAFSIAGTKVSQFLLPQQVGCYPGGRRKGWRPVGTPGSRGCPVPGRKSTATPLAPVPAWGLTVGRR